MDETSLERAVEQGIITSEQRDAILAIDQGRQPVSAYGDDERFRLISGFNDIFLSLGIALFVFGLMVIALIVARHMTVLLVGVIVMWLLSELFAARLRITLPSIVSACGYVLFVSLLVGFFLSDDLCRSIFHLEQSCLGKSLEDYIRQSGGSLGWIHLIPAIPLLASLVYYARFRLPFALFLVAGAALVAVYFPVVTLVYGNNEDLLKSLSVDTRFIRLYAGSMGLLFFVIAMIFDLSDRQRMTRRSDAAFWLHLAAAPMIVHAIMGGWAGGPNLVATVGVFAVFMIIALLVDRRAILVASLLYIGTSFAFVFNRLGIDLGGGESASRLALTMVALGATVLVLGIGWRPLRRGLLGLLPGGFARALPVAH